MGLIRNKSIKKAIAAKGLATGKGAADARTAAQPTKKKK